MQIQIRNQKEITFELLNPGDVFYYNGDYYLVYTKNPELDENKALLIGDCDFYCQDFSNDTVVEVKKATLVIE